MVVCIKKTENFEVNKTYKYELNSGIVFAPWIVAEKIQVISDKQFSPKKSIKSRYSKSINTNNFEEINVNKKKGKTLSTFKVFYDEKNCEIFDEDKFQEHFATLKEYRKMKLNKLKK